MLLRPGPVQPSLNIEALRRIADKRILRLLAKWLKVGIVEDGCVTRSERGAPQGAVISPILANIYLHYVYDLWVHPWRRTKASSDMTVIRYADDTIVGFQHEHEAKAFLDDLKERMRAFELALNPDKTRLIRFGRHAAKQRQMRGEGKPETFELRVPSVAEEDARRLHRERDRLVSERVQHVNRIKGLCALQGIYDYNPLRPQAMARLEQLRTAQGGTFPPRLKSEIMRGLQRLEMVLEMIATLEAERNAIVENEASTHLNAKKIQTLHKLKAIGPEFAAVLVGEIFHRDFNNRRQVASCVGLAPSPFQSGNVAHDQRISKAGNRKGRTTGIELAWMWLRYQPEARMHHDRYTVRWHRMDRHCTHPQSHRGWGILYAVGISQTVQRRAPSCAGRGTKGAWHSCSGLQPMVGADSRVRCRVRCRHRFSRTAGRAWSAFHQLRRHRHDGTAADQTQQADR